MTDKPKGVSGGTDAREDSPSLNLRRRPVLDGATRTLRVSVFRNVDPDCPAAERFIAHAFDQSGRLHVATKLGGDERCGEALAAFLDDEIASERAFLARRSPARMKAIRARAAKGLAV